ncbi:hypothetical protein [Aliivibrio kagoshimensis]|uniref:hypothetical protein n=1 Tax=Aliivibrio kagoshimensis TaxID=2910230 RepID=UPI003D146FEE
MKKLIFYIQNSFTSKEIKMKKFGFLLLMLFSTTVNAEYQKGTIDKIRMCGTGESGWIRTVQFQINGKWFGTYADHHYGAGGTSYDNNQTTSMLFMAFSQAKVVEINANGGWDKYFTKCGQANGITFHGRGGDYIQLSRE